MTLPAEPMRWGSGFDMQAKHVVPYAIGVFGSPARLSVQDDSAP